MKTKQIADYSALVKEALNPSYARLHKMWVKRITDIDLNSASGYAFIGDFLSIRQNALTENEMDTDALYVLFGEYGSMKNHEPYAALARWDNGEFKVVDDFMAIGKDWALYLRNDAYVLLWKEKEESDKSFDPAEFIAALSPECINRLKNHLNNATGDTAKD